MRPALAEILAGTVLGEVDGRNARASVIKAAEQPGTAFGQAEHAGSRPGQIDAERTPTLASASLEQLRFEPEHTAATTLLLRNCPFRPLAAKGPDLVYGISHRFLDGDLPGLSAKRCTAAVLHPRAPTPATKKHAEISTATSMCHQRHANKGLKMTSEGVSRRGPHRFGPRRDEDERQCSMAYSAKSVSRALVARAPFQTAEKRSILPQGSSSRAVMPRGIGPPVSVHS